MSLLADMKGIGKEFEFSPEKKVVLEQLSVDELTEFTELLQKQKMKDSLKFILTTTLKKSIHDCTDEEINKLNPPLVSK